MGIIAAGMGGSGTEWFIRTVNHHGYQVGRRADVVFRREKWECGRDFQQHVTTLVDSVRPDSLHEFCKRAEGYHQSWTKGCTVNNVVLDYCNHVRQGEKRAALFSMVPAWGFFSTNCISNVVFQIRHPISVYLSHTAPGRNAWETTGLLPKAAEWTGTLWAAHVIEYLELQRLGLDPVLIRYEHAKEDAARDPRLVEIYNSFEMPPLRDESEAHDPAALETVEQYTRPLAEELYGGWERS